MDQKQAKPLYIKQGTLGGIPKYYNPYMQKDKSISFHKVVDGEKIRVYSRRDQGYFKDFQKRKMLMEVPEEES